MRKDKATRLHILNISKFCNNNCKFCYNSGGNSIKPISLGRELKRELAKARKSKADTVALFGGEPTIHPDLFQFMREINRAGFAVRMETNGRMFAYEGFCKKIFAHDVHSLQISIHGRNPDLHDWATGVRGSFYQTMRGLQNVRKIKPHIHISSFTVISKKNHKDLPRIVKFIVEDLGIRLVNLSFIEVAGNAKSNGAILVEFSKAEPYVNEALYYLKTAKEKGYVDQFYIEKGPACVTYGFYGNYRYEKRLASGGSYIKNEPCLSCPLNDGCVGFPIGYVEKFGFDGQRVGGFDQDDLRYYFSGIDMNRLEQSKKLIRFDAYNDAVFIPSKGMDLKSAKSAAKKIGVSSLMFEGSKTPVYDDPRYKLPDQILKYDKETSEDGLISAIIKQADDDFKLPIKNGNVCLTTGARHSLFLILMTIIVPGDEIILQDPCWEGYANGIGNLGGAVKTIKKEVTLSEIKKKISQRTKAIIVTNPYLKDFTSIPQKEMKKIAEFCLKNNLFFIVDEIINRFPPRPRSILDIIDTEKYPVAIVNSFSKNYFMSDYRTGYVISNKKLIKKIKRIVEFSDFKITQKSLKASLAALDHSQKWRDDLASAIYKRGRY